MTRLSGVLPVLVSPFDKAGVLDVGDIVAQVTFCIANGADGVVYPGAVSEYFTLSQVEWREALRAIVKAAGGKPVVAGVSSTSTELACELAARAADLGAAALMSMLPPVNHLFSPDTEFAIRHFDRIAAVCPLPIVLQNARMGTPLTAAQEIRVVETVPSVRYVKEETAPSTHKLTQTIASVSRRVDGVFAGIGAIYLQSELARGACGTMPSPAFVDVIVRAYRLYLEGSVAESRAAVTPLAPLFNYELLYNFAFIKEVLRHRGVISSTESRAAAPRIDDIDRAEFEWLFAALDALTSGGYAC